MVMCSNSNHVIEELKQILLKLLLSPIISSIYTYKWQELALVRSQSNLSFHFPYIGKCRDMLDILFGSSY